MHSASFILINVSSCSGVPSLLKLPIKVSLVSSWTHFPYAVEELTISEQVLPLVIKSVSPQKVGLVLCLGKAKSRKVFLKKINKKKFKFPIIIDKNLSKFENVNIGKGTIILGSTNISNNTSIGKFCIIGTNTNILHDVKIGDNCIIGGGTIIGANVTLHKEIFVGVGTIFASKKITVKENCYICSGSVVLNNLPKNCKVIGNPARIIPEKK